VASRRVSSGTGQWQAVGVPDDLPIGDWLSSGPSDAGEVAARYDAWAQSYDDDLTAWSYQAPEVVAQTVVTRQPEAASVLDIGCGTGLVGRALRARGFEGQLHGLDISTASLAIAEQEGAYDALDAADLQRRLPVDDESADAVVCVGVMTYLPDVEAVWRELARVARPGGLVVVTQREDLWAPRGCQAVIDRMQDEGLWTTLELTGPAAYLPDGYGGTPAVACYYLTARVT
jgi:ubiquinone/menaquinone biosynthesis C-methylase UbiE